MSREDKNLKELMAEFEQVVGWFDSDELDIEDATKKFEEGAELAELIKARLEEAKNEIEIVKKKFDGNASEFDETEANDL